MKIDYEDLPESVQEHISRMEVAMHDIQWELKMHRFVALLVFGWALERLVRWFF